MKVLAPSIAKKRTGRPQGYAIAAAALGSLVAYAATVEPGCLVVRRVEVLIPELPASLAGLRIGQLSDLHWGPLIPGRRLRRAVALLAAEQPDVVALTGDFVSYWPRYAAGYSRLLAPLRPRLGTFACTGNHDHWTQPELVVAELRSAGVNVLRNQHHGIAVGTAQLSIIGVDDVGISGFSLFHAEPTGNLPAALADVPASGVLRLLLVHNPDFVLDPVFVSETAERPIHLVLAGHTHGGQIRLPFVGAPHLPSRFGQLFGGGLVEAGGTQVYVSRGVGASWPVRFGCPPEVNVLTLRAG